MNSELLSAVQREWRIFPLLRPSRHATAQPLSNHATSNEAQVEQWETQYPECRWAVATGSESGIFALNFTLDTAVTSMREFGEIDRDLSRTLQVQGPNQIFTFWEWPALGLSRSGQGTLPTGVRLIEAGDYVPIPGPGMSADRHYGYLDREAPVLPPSEWMLDLIHGENGGHRGARILAFRPASNAVPCVLLSFERRGDRWYCDFYEGSGTAKVRKTLCYGSSDKVVSLAVKGGAFARPNTRCNLFAAIEVGRGRILLNLTSEQYQKLIAA